MTIGKLNLERMLKSEQKKLQEINNDGIIITNICFHYWWMQLDK